MNFMFVIVIVSCFDALLLQSPVCVFVKRVWILVDVALKADDNSCSQSFCLLYFHLRSVYYQQSDHHFNYTFRKY